MNFDSSLLPVSQNFLPRGPKKDSKVCECLSSESFPFHRYINLKGKQRARAAATSGTLGVWPGSPPAHRTAERGDGRERRRERDAVYWFPRYHVSSQNSKCLRSINSTPLFWLSRRLPRESIKFNHFEEHVRRPTLPEESSQPIAILNFDLHSRRMTQGGCMSTLR